MAHLGLIDLLAWDLKSKKANLPAYKLMGGNDPKIPAYASTVTWDDMGEYERHIKECVDEGFVAFKLHAWGDWKEDASLCRNLRKWTGDDATLMFDGSAGWDLVTSLKFGRVLEECGFYWYEEPMREFDLAAYAKLAKTSISRFSPPRRRTACTGMPRPGSTWRRSTWSAPRASTKAALPAR